ncbi:MAG: hypothetical protein EXR75_09705 [Myxococcales bacterium]|nr:hypothetical protein [Myxococcales bacterium]
MFPVFAFVAAVGCGNKAVDPAEKERAGYGTAIAETRDMVGVVAAFLPYLEAKPAAGKYVPKRRADLDRGASFAANSIRGAANRARLKLLSSPSDVPKALTEAFIAITKACQDADGAEALGVCRASVDALDKALAEAGTKAAALGITEKFPRVSSEFIADKAKKELAPFLMAMGVGAKVEDAYFAVLADEKAAPRDVYEACKTAETEAELKTRELEKVNDELRKVAAVHEQSLEGQCVRLNRTDGTWQELAPCKKDKKKDECVLACSKAKAIVAEGIPAAAFAKMADDVAELCKDEDEPPKR